MVLMDEHTPPPGAYAEGVGRGRRQRILVESIKQRRKKKYFYSLSVNYTNRSPAVGNDSQNSINCRRRAAIIYVLTINILTNNSVARLYFIMPRIMLFSYSYARQKINNRKKSADSLAISMTMRIRQYGAKRIAQSDRSTVDPGA
jgi:hypothetical protein